MTIAFRVDASFQIGTGHVMRCLTLAKALRENGEQCVFVCRDQQGNLNESLKAQGFSVGVLPDLKNAQQSNDEPLLDHTHWLGASRHIDAQQTIEALGRAVVDWLIVDHYALDKYWESQLRPYTKRVMVIDDLADREHDCDLLLDHNLVENFENRYNPLLDGECARLLGPKYALLQPGYSEMRSRTPPRTGPVRRIFVYFGGSDIYNLTGLTVSAFLRLKRHDVKLDVVISPNSLNRDILRSQVAAEANITLHEGVPSLIPLIAKSDLAIGASGTTTWERCCLGLPALVVTIAQNQRHVANSLAKQGIVRWVGDHQNLTIETLSQAIHQELDGSSLYSWSRACSNIVDGKGVERVVSALTLNASSSLKLRLVEIEDESILLDWANDPLVRRNSFNTSLIHTDTHRRWFYSQIKNFASCKFYIAETQGGLSIGQVRFLRNANEQWEIHYGLWIGARGKGLAAKLVKLAIERLRAEHPTANVIAYVKPDNIPSKRVFEILGFSEYEKEAHSVYILNFESRSFSLKPKNNL